MASFAALVKKFSDFIEHPVVMDVEKENEDKTKNEIEETLNTRKAIWLRNKSEVKPEEYEEFYKQLAHDDEAPAKIIHYAAEGQDRVQGAAVHPGPQAVRASTARNRTPGCGCTSSASSSWTAASNCCRSTCGS